MSVYPIIYRDFFTSQLVSRFSGGELINFGGCGLQMSWEFKDIPQMRPLQENLDLRSLPDG